MAILLLLGGLAITAKMLHAFKGQTEMIVAPFEMPAGSTHTLWTGKTVANVFTDDLQQIITNASEFRGRQFSSKRQYYELPDVPKIPIEKTFDLQFQGLSAKQLESAWHSLRYHQQFLSGDIILNKDDTLTLRARMASDKMVQYWEVSYLASGNKIRRTADDLKSGLQQLAIEIFSSLHPEIAGRYLLTLAMSSPYPDPHYLKEAEKIFQRWVKKEPSRPQPFFYLSYTYSQFPHRSEESRLAAEQALDNDPSFHFAKGTIAWVLDQEALYARAADERKAFEKAIKEYKDALKTSRKWWQVWAIGPPHYWNNLCADYIDMGYFDDAEIACGNAINSDPEYVVPQLNLGVLYTKRAKTKASDPNGKKKDLEAAEAAYRRALKERPDYFPALHNLSKLLASLRRRGDAERECKKARALFPSAPEPIIELGTLHEAEREMPKAYQYYLKASKIDPTNPHSWDALGRIELGWARDQKASRYIRQKFYAKASKHFKKGFDLSHDPFMQGHLGQALVGQARPKDGLEALQAALKMRPMLKDDQWFERDLGDAYLGEQKCSEALKAYSAAERLNEEEHKKNNKMALFSNDREFKLRMRIATKGAGNVKGTACTAK